MSDQRLLHSGVSHCSLVFQVMQSIPFILMASFGFIISRWELDWLLYREGFNLMLLHCIFYFTFLTWKRFVMVSQSFEHFLIETVMLNLLWSIDFHSFLFCQYLIWMNFKQERSEANVPGIHPCHDRDLTDNVFLIVLFGYQKNNFSKTSL